MKKQKTISLRELVELGRITSEDGTQLPDYDETWIREHGNKYRVAPNSVSFILRHEHNLYPSEPLDQVFLDGFYTVSRDSLKVNMGRKVYELHNRPIEGDHSFRTKTTIVEFKER